MIPLDVLDAVTIPIACPVPWDAMHGDHRTRFCDQCRQNVHDVSELNRTEAIELISGSKMTPCLRIYRRTDGRVLTADCTNRRERMWKWLHKRSTWAAWLFALVAFAGCDSKPDGCTAGEPPPPPMPSVEALHSVLGGPAAVSASRAE